MGARITIMIFAILGLAACNRGTPPPPLYPNPAPPQGGYRPGFPAPGTPVPSTPLTPLEMVKNHAAFSQLVQTPVCAEGAETVELEAFETRVGRVETDDQDREVVCDDFVQLLLDARSSTVRIVEQCLYQGDVYRKHLNTTAFAIEGNTLVVRDAKKKVYVRIDVASDGTSLNLKHSGAKKAGLLTKSGRIVLKSDTDTYTYNVLCQ